MLDTVSEFKRKTALCFHRINGMDSDEIEDIIKQYIQSKLNELNISADIIELAIDGSRSRGLERSDSDLDVVVEFDTEEREDYLFDILHEDGFRIDDVSIDINPITLQRTGDLSNYLDQAEHYLAQKSKCENSLKEVLVF